MGKAYADDSWVNIWARLGDRQYEAKRDLPFFFAVLVGLTLGIVPRPIHPALFGCATFLTVLIGVSTVTVPWRRMPDMWRGTPALAYFAVILLLQLGSDNDVSGFGPLTTIPIIWLAFYGNRTQMILATVATTLIFGLPVVAPHGQSLDWVVTFRLFTLWSLLAPIIGFTLRYLIERSRHEQSRAEAILRAVTAHSVIGTDADGLISVFNAGAERMLGYSAAEMIGKMTPASIHDPTEVRARAAELGIEPGFEVFVACCKAGDPETREWTYVRKDGSRLSVVLSVAPLRDAAGGIVGYVGIGVDVSRLRQAEASLSESERRYRALADAIPQKVWVADPDGRIEYVNEGWSAYTGVSVEAAPLAQEPVHPEDRAGLAAQLCSLPGTTRLAALELRMRRDDGVYRWHLVRAVPLRPENGAPGKWLVSATDIEERKAAEATLASAHATALDGSAAKSRFLATMSHEIRTPMSGIIGMCELLSGMSLGDEEREIAGVIHSSAKSLLRILNDVLDFSKMDAGKLQLEPLVFEIASEVQAVIGLQTAQATQKRIVLRTALDDNIPVNVFGDAPRLRQILLNLVSNAIKFTPSGGVVEIGAAPSDASCAAPDARLEITFRVSDSGIGIPADVREAIFDPFVQADGSITRRYGGTGLGLTICKQLVELMGGSIRIDAAAGAGACVEFILPFERVDAAAPIPAARRSDEPQSRPRSVVRPERILLAEDNPINALLAVKQLRHLGFETVVAPNGKVAVALWQEHPYDLILMDCHMPEMDGFSATRAIRSFDGEHPGRRPAIIVAMTADARAQDREACAAAGMDDYIAKPAELADIERILVRWLGAAARPILV